MRTFRRIILAALLCAPAAAPAGEISITPYIWIPGVEGSVGTPGGDTGLGDRVSFDFNRFADSIRLGGAMVNLAYRQDRFIVFGDWTYANVRSEAPTRLALVYPTVQAQIKGNVLQLFNGYDILEEGSTTLGVFLGGRAYDLGAGLKLTGAAVPDLKADGASFWIDAVAGLRLDSRFSNKWLLHLRGDLGAGGSNVSWQAYAGLGYEFSWGALMAGYRHLYIDKGEGSLQTKLTLSGALVGAHFVL